MPDQDFTPQDELAVLRAQLDQAAALAPLVAGLARSFFAAFVAEGFAEHQALYLTMAQILSNPGRPA
jgi:hypothetical protein